jgi:hypothetical protein
MAHAASRRPAHALVHPRPHRLDVEHGHAAVHLGHRTAHERGRGRGRQGAPNGQGDRAPGPRPERVVDERLALLAELRARDRGHDAHDLDLALGLEALPDRVLPGEELAGELLVDHRHRRGRGVVGAGEHAAPPEGDA